MEQKIIGDRQFGITTDSLSTKINTLREQLMGDQEFEEMLADHQNPAKVVTIEIIRKNHARIRQALETHANQGIDMLVGDMHCLYRYIQDGETLGLSVPKILFRFCKDYPGIAYSELLDAIVFQHKSDSEWLETCIQSLTAMRSHAKDCGGDEGKFLLKWRQ